MLLLQFFLKQLLHGGLFFCGMRWNSGYYFIIESRGKKICNRNSTHRSNRNYSKSTQQTHTHSHVR